MNNTVKIILALLAGVILICLVIGSAGMILMQTVNRTVGNALQSDPTQVTEIAWGIAEYDLPAGFEIGYAKQLAGFDLVTYTGLDEHSHVIFFQLPEGVHVDLDELERQLRQATGDPAVHGGQAKVVDRMPVTIRGQQTTLLVSEGTNSEGQAFRQVMAMFQGKQGQALVVFERPAVSWDQTEADTFIASIR
jgi:hypothetical protein